MKTPKVNKTPEPICSSCYADSPWRGPLIEECGRFYHSGCLPKLDCTGCGLRTSERGMPGVPKHANCLKALAEEIQKLRQDVSALEGKTANMEDPLDPYYF